MALDQPELTLDSAAGESAFGLVKPRRSRPLGGLRRLAWRYTPILLLALAWEATTRLGLVSPLEMPALDQVLTAWWSLLASGDLVSNGAVSLARGAAGLGLAIIVGVPLGVTMAWYKPVRTLFNPIVQAFYPMPKSALIPVTVLFYRLHAADHA
jgi:NitT/TauT family transport system permease protein